LRMTVLNGAAPATEGTVGEGRKVRTGKQTSKPESKSTQAKSWRHVLPVHPACKQFDPLPDAELRELADDIKANGLRIPITRIEVAGSSGKVMGKPVALLDGQNRLDALEATGHVIKFENDCGGGPEWFAVGWHADGKSYAVDIHVNMLAGLAPGVADAKAASN